MKGDVLRKAAAFCLAGVIVLSAAGCGRAGNKGKEALIDHKAQLASAGVDLKATPNVSEKGGGVAIVYPKAMFDGVDVSDEFIEVNEYIDGYVNDDGSVTIVMSKERQQEFLAAYKDDVDYNIEYFIPRIDYLERITYTDDFRTMDIFVDGSTDIEILYELPFFFSMPFENYQLTLGQNIWMVMNVADAKTGEIILSLVFPDADEMLN